MFHIITETSTALDEYRRNLYQISAPHRTEEGSGGAPPLTAEEVEALTLTAEANRVL